MGCHATPVSASSRSRIWIFFAARSDGPVDGRSPGRMQRGRIAEEHIPESPPDPSYRAVIANYLKTTFKNYSSYEAFEISDPRWVHAFQGWNWLTCVRFVDRNRRRTYVLILNGTTIVDAHYAVQTDDCGAQTYSVFEQMGGWGLDPIH